MSRVLTALVLIPLVLYVVLWGPPWLVPAVASLVAVICYQEYSSIAAAYQMGDPGPLGYVVGLALMLVPTEFTLPLLAGCAILALTLAMRQADLGKALPRATLLVTGVVYIFGCWRFASLLHRASPYWLLFGLVLCWIGDAGAYYVGRRLGRHKLAPRISPGKSWEGAIASVAVSVLFGVFYLARFLPSVPAAAAIAISAVANITGQLGDLAESAIKRGAGVKDSGTILPGHGGFLDRVDSTLFVLPVVYLYIRFVQ